MRKKINLIGITLGSMGLLCQANASTVYSKLGIQNNNSSTFLLTGVTNSGSDSWCATYQNPNVPISCYGSLPNAQTQWSVLGSNTAWIQFDYDVCNGAIDYSGSKPKCISYLGHFGIQFTSASVTLNGIAGGTATLSPYQNQYTPRTVKFVSSAPVYNYPAVPSSYKSLPYRGVNLSGAEYDYSFAIPSIDDGAFYAAQGMNTVRLPFKWEYLQSSSSNPREQVNDPKVSIDFNNPNAKAYASLVRQLTAKGMYVIVDMHNYMRYGTSQAIIGSEGAPTSVDYANAWRSIATEFKNDSHVIFDLMNEPNEMPTELILSNYNAAIAAIRAVGANHLILLEGNHWSSARYWSTSMDGYTANSKVFVPSAIKDNHYAINVHQYFDANYSGTGECLSNSIPDISDLNQYLKDNGLKAIITELGGNNTQVCANDINNFLKSLPNDGTYLGWTGWSGGTNAISLFNYFGPNTVTMTDGYQPNLSLPNPITFLYQ